MCSQESCCLKSFVDNQCHSERFRATKCFLKVRDLSQEEVQNLISRVPEIKIVESTIICDYHYRAYVRYYKSHDICTDPWKKHPKNITSNLCIVDFKLSQEASKINIAIISGRKLCKNCFYLIKKKIIEHEKQFEYCADPFKRHRKNKVINTELYNLNEESLKYLISVENCDLTLEHKICSVCNNYLRSCILEHKEKETVTSLTEPVCPREFSSEDFSAAGSYPHGSSDSDFQTNSQSKRTFDSILDSLDLPPFKRQKMNEKDLIYNSKDVIQGVVNKVSKAFEEAHGITLPPTYNSLRQLSAESTSFNSIIGNLKLKYDHSSTSYDEKVSILTVLPKEWRYLQTSHYFNCNKYMFKEARKIRENKGKYH